MVYFTNIVTFTQKNLGRERKACFSQLLHQEVMMTYFDSAEDLTISKQRALQELAKHGVVASDIDVFFPSWVRGKSTTRKKY